MKFTQSQKIAWKVKVVVFQHKSNTENSSRHHNMFEKHNSSASIGIYK